MDEVFGEHPGRPEHPDLWKMWDTILMFNGAYQAGENVLKDRVAKVVDLNSLLYLATERAIRVVRLTGGTETGPNDREVKCARGSFIEGFVCGYHFARESNAGRNPSPSADASG
ncbi:MAG: hypothetical protein ACYDD4_07435 [Acidimicrobiales bacterium]